MKMQSKTSNIIEYYDSCESDYRIFWNLDDSLAMHAGFWDHTTKTLSEALARENEVLAEFASIKSHEKVLDAGCGLGGSSFFLAKQYQCEVIGITLSEHQVEKAKSLAAKNGLDSLVQFKTMDYCRTSFQDASFDVVWAIESVCHAENKEQFVEEAFRLLKKGGRLILADGFGTFKLYKEEQSLEMERWLNGWGVERLEEQETFLRYLTEAGFSDIKYFNATENILPSSKRLYWISFPATVLSTIGEWFGLRKKIQTKNILAAYYQYSTLKKGLWEYGFFCARKK